MNLKEYASYDAVGLAELVKNGEVTPKELLDLAIEGIEKTNPELNAVIHVLREEAEKAIEEGIPDGDFAGVPFLLKEVLCHAAGVPSEVGSRMGEGVKYPIDSYLMERFRKAGFVLIGTTPTPEFGYNITTESLYYGATHNPWKKGYSSGGSSGGASAAVAAGMVPIAHGNDGGGSIRIPASYSGVVGLKPSRGRVTAGPFNSEPLAGLGVELALTKTIRDTAYLLDIASEPQPGEYCSVAMPEKPYKEIIKEPVRKLRIAYSKVTPLGKSIEGDSLRALEETVQWLRDLGHELVEDAPVFDVEDFLAMTNDIWTASLYDMIEGTAKATGRTPSPELLEGTIWNCYEHGKALTAGQYIDAVHRNANITRIVGEWMNQYDAFLTPTTFTEAIKHGVANSNNPDLSSLDYTKQILGELAPFTALFNTTGQPAISLPLHMSQNGLPIGMQFAGRAGDEATLLQLGLQLENAHPWTDRVPAIHVSK